MFNVEYDLKPDEFCDRAVAMGFMSLQKDLELGPRPEAC